MKSDSLFVVIILIVGVIYELMALRMPRGNLAYPGPGFYPILVGIFLILSAGCCLGWTFIKSKPERTDGVSDRGRNELLKSTRVSIGKTLQLVGLLFFYILTLKYLGFLIAIFIFMLVCIRIFGHRKWLSSLGITAVIVTISYISFVIWLKVPLPRGILDEILG